jgi:hypothetical protein
MSDVKSLRECLTAAGWPWKLIQHGWRRCPDGVWRKPADWPPYRPKGTRYG